MIITNGVQVSVKDVRADRTKVHNISLADVVVTDILMDLLLNNKVDSIKGLETMTVNREIAIESFKNILSDKSEMTVVNYQAYMDMIEAIQVAVRVCNAAADVDKLSLGFATSEGVVNAFTFLKLNIFNGKHTEVHYIVPLIPNLLHKYVSQALYIDGDGNAEFILLPSRDANGETKFDADKFVEYCQSKKTYGFLAMDLIKHNKLIVLEKEKFNRAYYSAFKENTEDGVGLRFDISSGSKVLLADRLTDKFLSAPIDFEKIQDSNYLLVLQDARTYTDRLMEADTYPITITALNQDQIVHSGIDFDKIVVEKRDLIIPYNEADTSTALGRGVEKTKRLPRVFYDEMKKIMATLRTFLVSYRRAKDDELKEKVINDEFVPILDNSLKWIIGGATTYGSIFVMGTAPLVGLLAGAMATVIKKIDDKEKREKALKIIKDELVILEEKINDSRNSDDRQAKYAMMRTKLELEKKLEGIVSTRKFV